MKQSEQVHDIYTHLPPIARQEALDFLLFLQQQYSDTTSQINQATVNDNSSPTIRDNPAFGMWSDLENDSAEILQQIRQEQWK